MHFSDNTWVKIYENSNVRFGYSVHIGFDRNWKARKKNQSDKHSCTILSIHLLLLSLLIKAPPCIFQHNTYNSQHLHNDAVAASAPHFFKHLGYTNPRPTTKSILQLYSLKEKESAVLFSHFFQLHPMSSTWHLYIPH